MTPNQQFINELEHLNTNLGVRVFAKDQKWVLLWAIIDWLTASRQLKEDNRKTSDRFVTVIGSYIFFTNGWREKDATLRNFVTLKHEAVHMCWMKKLGLGSIWVGTVIFSLLYLLCFFPVGLAYFRYAAERAAYVISYKEGKLVGIHYSIDRLVELMTGPAYFWAWPFKKSVRAYFEKHCK